MTLVTIELVKRDIAWLHETDKAIEDFKKKHPEVRRNPRALAKIYSYRQPMANALSKNLSVLGPSKVGPKTLSLQELLEHGDSEEGSEGNGIGNESGSNEAS